MSARTRKRVVVSAVSKPSLSDPLCLDGLEPLLDQIFAVPNMVADFAPDAGTRERTDKLRSVTEHADFYSVEPTLEDQRNKLLTSQLKALKTEIKDVQFKNRHLELQLAAAEEQLVYMPELFSKVLELSGVCAENKALKQENAALLDSIDHMKPKSFSPSFGRRILNRFFGK